MVDLASKTNSRYRPAAYVTTDSLSISLSVKEEISWCDSSLGQADLQLESEAKVPSWVRVAVIASCDLEHESSAQRSHLIKNWTGLLAASRLIVPTTGGHLPHSEDITKLSLVLEADKCVLEFTIQSHTAV